MTTSFYRQFQCNGLQTIIPVCVHDAMYCNESWQHGSMAPVGIFHFVRPKLRTNWQKNRKGSARVSVCLGRIGLSSFSGSPNEHRISDSGGKRRGGGRALSVFYYYYIFCLLGPGVRREKSVYCSCTLGRPCMVPTPQNYLWIRVGPQRIGRQSWWKQLHPSSFIPVFSRLSCRRLHALCLLGR